MIRNKKSRTTYLLIILLLGITLGYAYLNTTLNITGTTNITSANWNIYWDNIVFGSNNVSTVNSPATISQGLTEVTFNVNFSQPGDTYEFTVDAVNDGSINAMVSVVSNGVYASNGTTPKNLPDYLEYSVTYSDGTAIAENHLLESGDTATYKVRVHYKEDITSSQLPSTNDNCVFKFSVTYVQATNAARPAVPDPVSFSTDSWGTITWAVKSGNTSVYHVGDTKTIDMGSFGTHTLRIANTTTPTECGTTGFSQTACGFVLEFSDIVARDHMNSAGTNVGGWPDSLMRSYVNNDIYNALPETLKRGIINTNVVAGHGSTSGETNFTSTDKLYLLGFVEIYGSNNEYYDTVLLTETRQLDYYAGIPVTTSSVSGAKKQFEGSYSIWWLRSASYNNTSYFSYITNGGYWSDYVANATIGISPAFRLG